MPRKLTISLLAALLAVTTAAGGAQNAESTEASGVQNWSDFIHYLRIALPDLAGKHGEHLLELVGDDHELLLRIVEKSPYADNYEADLERAMKMAGLEQTARKLAARVQQAKIHYIRDGQRILDDIRRLNEGDRARLNAMQRLQAAGQFASPMLLRVLISDKADDQAVQSRLVDAIGAIGRPMVYPLAVALADLEPVHQALVAKVLANIGYPRAAPYLKAVLESEGLDRQGRARIPRADDQLAEMFPTNVTATELFLTLGENLYEAATIGDPKQVPGFDEQTRKGIVWRFDRRTGLAHTPVPSAIFGDVLAMEAARTSLRLNPNLNQALSLWLMANVRRQNRLPAGQVDPSYPPGWHTPQFYLEMAGPLRQHDVLHRALDDDDVNLALDTIGALDATAGTDALLNREGAIQPLLDALAYPNRRVRFAAAFALTNARPGQRFDGSYQVVPILIEALRQSGQRHVLVVAGNQSGRNVLAGAIQQVGGFMATGGLSLKDPDLVAQVKAAEGIDLIVTDYSAAECLELLRQAEADYHLAHVPVLALVSRGDQIEILRLQIKRLIGADADLRAGALAVAMRTAIETTSGAPVSVQEANAYVKRAIGLLGQVALSHGQVYNVHEAEPALVKALQDARPFVAKGAGRVLALLDSPTAQQALAIAAVDGSRPEPVRISLLNSLAQSAKHYGQKLTPLLIDRVLNIVQTSRQDLAVAAARAAGALTLPASHLKQMLDVP